MEGTAEFEWKQQKQAVASALQKCDGVQWAAVCGARGSATDLESVLVRHYGPVEDRDHHI